MCTFCLFREHKQRRVRSTMNRVLTACDFLITRRRPLRRIRASVFVRGCWFIIFLEHCGMSTKLKDSKTSKRSLVGRIRTHTDTRITKKKHCFLDQEIRVTVLTRVLTRIAIYKYPRIVDYINRVLHAIHNTHVKGVCVAKVFFRIHVPSNVRPRVLPRYFQQTSQSDGSYFKRQQVLLANRSAASSRRQAE